MKIGSASWLQDRRKRQRWAQKKKTTVKLFHPFEQIALLVLKTKGEYHQYSTDSMVLRADDQVTIGQQPQGLFLAVRRTPYQWYTSPAKAGAKAISSAMQLSAKLHVLTSEGIVGTGDVDSLFVIELDRPMASSLIRCYTVGIRYALALLIGGSGGIKMHRLCPCAIDKTMTRLLAIPEIGVKLIGTFE